jgi:GAF domain-containing protein
MKCPRCQQENPPQAKFCSECAAPFKLPHERGAPTASYTDLQRAPSEALEKQTTTSEVFRVISSSAIDVQPVLGAIARTAARLCEAGDALIYLVDGDRHRLVAKYGRVPQPQRVGDSHPIRRDTPLGQAVLDRRPVHVRDISVERRRRFSGLQAFGLSISRVRTLVAMPLLRDGVTLGGIVIRRTRVRPFTAKQIALLKTFADQAAIAIENVRLFAELEEKNRALTQAHGQVTEALEQQTATSEILRVISSSHTDLQPVFDAILHSAGRLCDATFGALQLFDGEHLTLDGHYGISPEDVAMLQAQVFPMRPDMGSSIGRAIIRRDTVHIEDIRSDPEFRVSALQTREGYRTALSVPMLRGDIAVGVINLWRRDVHPFSQTHIDMVQTFADQAVIAIENVRLFKELEARNRDLTATSEILQVISRSPTDVQPVFETIVSSGRRLCDAEQCALVGYDGEMLTLLATSNFTAEGEEAMRRAFPYRANRSGTAGRAVLDRAVVHIPDVMQDSEYAFKETAKAAEYRAHLGIPLFRDADVVGVLIASRAAPKSFSQFQIDLLKTFADQAVIAIENVRLFTELQDKNRALTEAHTQVSEALERQTATSEILRVISSSPTDVQPVFESLVASAARLCGANDVLLLIRESDVLRPTAGVGSFLKSLAADFRVPLVRGSVAARSVIDGATLHVPDLAVLSEADFPVGRDLQRRFGHRTVLAVPLFREGVALGTIFAMRFEVRPFADQQVELLKTFADQAVIAIENARLFKELEERTQELTRSVDQLTALGEVGRAVSSTLDLETVLTTIVSRAVQLSGLDGGVVFEYDDGAEEFVHRAGTETPEALAELRRTTRIRKGEGVLGRTAITLEPVQVPDIAVPDAYEGRLREILIESGVRAILAVPMVRESRLIGCLGVTRNRAGDFPAETIELLRTFATQSALAIQNARLFQEIADKSRQLEIASQHKSEFLANMSHELRTPLNAVIGFSEVLAERMFGELNEKQDEYVRDIYASGTHLLSLINDILDLSKVEAGRMELELADFHLPQAIENALVLVRERALRRGIMLEQSIDPRLGEIQGDERKVKQVLLNLLSNAIKFTPEGGKIEIRAVPGDRSVEVSVSDTGVGIAPEDQDAIFEEFRQVGTAAKKVEGTGLGLALSRKFIELHGGRIWVQSEVGKGSMFRFTLPMS